MIEITSEQWAKIPKDYKGTFEGTKNRYAFAGSLRGVGVVGLNDSEQGTTLVAVTVRSARKVADVFPPVSNRPDGLNDGERSSTEG